MPAPQEIEKLVERFRNNRSAYESSVYKETQVRREFIDPFFKALGWDIDNSADYAEAYKDVVHEDAIRIGRSAKAPDYSFRVGGARRFFVEAKKPSVNVKDDVPAAYQLRRYAWSAKLPLSILTDFAEFAVYDCRVRPEPSDKPAVTRIMYLRFEDYLHKWDEIAAVFSKEAVLKGSFDRYAADTKIKKGTVEVDVAFLREIEDWRKSLAHNIMVRNKALALSQRDLNFAVQATIDRIVFLRICEDRGLEAYGELRNAASGRDIYSALLKLFERADQRYNSGLFHFQREKGRSEKPDELTPHLTVDDKVLKPIVSSLYYPHSPYEFAVLSADILGRVYEQFLGKAVVLRSGKVAVEEKPDVRKAGGVYYTPAFIVEYIVRETLGPLLQGRRVGQAASVKIVDPACGSGSFLIAAYQFLLDWHVERYLEMKRRPKQIYQAESGAWRLTLAERKRILLNCIHGVDIDPRAVEVAKLSLLLKVIEGETQMAFAIERLLPDLGQNIQCGNSIVAQDFYDTTLPGLDDEAEATINAFDWATAFPSVFAAGGFDAVIGNPPYLNVDDTWGKKDPRLAYLKTAYSSVYNDKTDLLFYFLAKAVTLTRGDVCLIVSRAFLEAFKADKLRAFLAGNTKTREIVDLRNAYVFEGVGITTAIVHLTKNRPPEKALVRRLRGDRLPPGVTAASLADGTLFESVLVDHDRFGAQPWLFTSSAVQSVIDTIDAAGTPIGAILHIGQGMQTGRNSVFGQRTAAEINSWSVPNEMRFVRARNSDIQRFFIADSGEYLLFTEPASSLAALSAGARQHLDAHRSDLEDRAAFRRGNCEWWRWTWPLHQRYMQRDKLLCPYLATGNRFALDRAERFLGLTDTTVLYDNDQPEDLRYFVGLLNSRLLTFRFRFIGKLKSGGILEYFWNSVSKLPIVRLDPADSRHERMVELVDRMMSLQDQLQHPASPSTKAALHRQIAAADRQIDALVYSLYGITAAQREVIDSVLAPDAADLDEKPNASVSGLASPIEGEES